MGCGERRVATEAEGRARDSYPTRGKTVKYKHTFLQAVFAGDIEEVARHLGDNPLYVTTEDEWHYRPLYNSVQKGGWGMSTEASQPDLVKFLIDSRSDIDHRPPADIDPGNGNTALMWCAHQNGDPLA